MKMRILLLVLAAGALATQPAFAHGAPAGAGGPPAGVHVGPPAGKSAVNTHISAEGALHSNGSKAAEREFGADRAADVHALKSDDKAADAAAKAADRAEDRDEKAAKRLAKAEDKSAKAAAKAADRAEDRDEKAADRLAKLQRH